VGEEVQSQLRRFGPQGEIGELVEAWSRIVGDAIAHNAWPARLSRDRVLHVFASSSVWAFELTQLAPELQRRLRQALGDLAPVRLKFAVGPVPQTPVESKEETATAPTPSLEARAKGKQLAAAIEDEELRNLVARAAAASLSDAESDRTL
jgi:hypothetical protein